MNRSTLAKLILSFAALSLVFAMFEVYSRVQIAKKNRQVVLSFYQEDPLLAQSLQPSVERKLESRRKGEFSVKVKTTSQGLRDIKVYEIPKPKDVFRILMLGDSFTFGHGVEVEDTFSKILEKSLNSQFPDQKFEVVNAGYASGFTWDEAYLFTKERGLKYEPDLIIENIWVGNDLTEIGDHDYPEVDEHGLPRRIVSTTTFVNQEGFMRLKLEPKDRRLKGIIGFFNELICDSSQFCKVLVRPLIDRQIKVVISKIKPQKPTSLFVQFLREEISPSLENNWRKGQKMLVALKDISRESQTDFMIVNIPVKEQVYDPQGVLVGESLKTKRLANFATSSSIDYCDLENELRQRERDKSYYKSDSHLTALGHQIVADSIEECILNYGFLKKES